MFAYRSTRTTFSRNAGYCLFYSLHIDGFLCSGMSMLTQQVASRIETTKVIEQTGVLKMAEFAKWIRIFRI
jgi:hypothetical protein